MTNPANPNGASGAPWQGGGSNESATMRLGRARRKVLCMSWMSPNRQRAASRVDTARLRVIDGGAWGCSRRARAAHLQIEAAADAR
jgi:hypothetical protein